jgi:hypothetical protein
LLSSYSRSVHTVGRKELDRMSLPQLLAGLVDQHGETIQQAALLAYLRQGEEAQPALEVCTTEYTE